MSDFKLEQTLTEAIAAELPFLRRYARALTGSQKTGDTYAAATLEAILADRSVFATDVPPKAALFRVFHGIWTTTGGTFDDAESSLEARAQKHLAGLTTGSREVLLMHSIERMPVSSIALVIGSSEDEVTELLNAAHREMSNSIAGRVLIIEDEAIIAMDLESIVTEMGHEVVGNARTRTDAVAMVNEQKPDLVLTDIQLADNSSGVDAARDILERYPDMPVIFITAFPERLLTGERPEPAFLITKPYSEDQVRSAVSQAMFFSSTETLKKA
ncbi:response regulator [Alphaproteobacteria bacterium GH1-50]|uniref:Response regulator n=1 Tax=Kangsaoukella pontilimi TaxID=2691042 RepID=A0A7C9IQV0_9RHOB|nr:response regulator [Kangsaoukella pontilimi]MXQ06726.1 response regulator [Kangsaoukella pontilimi]